MATSKMIKDLLSGKRDRTKNKKVIETQNDNNKQNNNTTIQTDLNNNTKLETFGDYRPLNKDKTNNEISNETSNLLNTLNLLERLNKKGVSSDSLFLKINYIKELVEDSIKKENIILTEADFLSFNNFVEEAENELLKVNNIILNNIYSAFDNK